MAEPDRTEKSEQPNSERPSERFQALTKRLLKVSKDEVRDAEAREREDRRAV